MPRRKFLTIWKQSIYNQALSRGRFVGAAASTHKKSKRAVVLHFEWTAGISDGRWGLHAGLPRQDWEDNISATRAERNAGNGPTAGVRPPGHAPDAMASVAAAACPGAILCCSQ